jgi:AcrR family transcriptional regulator
VADPSRRAEEKQATRSRIVEAAVQAFGGATYATVGVEEIARRAGVTTGAIYHHFDGKAGLFQAAAESVEEEIVRRLQSRDRNEDPWLDLLESVSSALAICMTPHVRQIAFIDAANVMGLGRWREIQARHGLGLLVSALVALVDRGYISTRDPELLARMLLAALIEAAETCSTSARGAEAVVEAEATLQRFLESLRSLNPAPATQVPRSADGPGAAMPRAKSE